MYNMNIAALNNEAIRTGFIRDNLEKVYRLLDMLRKCVLFYKSVGSTGAFSKAINLDKIDELKFAKIRQTLLPVLRKSEFVDLAGMQQNVKTYLKRLMVLTDKEKQYLDEFGNGYYRPELLFEDEIILNHIQKHPMAIWKTSGIRDSRER